VYVGDFDDDEAHRGFHRGHRRCAHTAAKCKCCGRYSYTSTDASCDGAVRQRID
jgi:uncharacterized OB-fold protein